MAAVEPETNGHADDRADADADEDEDGSVDSEDETQPDHAATIEAAGQEFVADDVVEAVAGAPSLQRLQASLGVDRHTAEDLLAALDLLGRFKDSAPLSHGVVQETVASYLEVSV